MLQTHHNLVAIRSLHEEVRCLRKDIDELRDTVLTRGGAETQNAGLVLLSMLNADQGDEDDTASVQSAPN